MLFCLHQANVVSVPFGLENKVWPEVWDGIAVVPRAINHNEP